MVSPCHKKIANNFRISNQKHKDVRFPKVTNVFDGFVENSLGRIFSILPLMYHITGSLFTFLFRFSKYLMSLMSLIG